MKVKGKELILKIVSLCATVLSFVGLAFKFALSKTTITGFGTHSESLFLKDWVDGFDPLDKMGVKAVNWWQVSRVFLIISLVLLGILAVITLVQFFFNHKYLSLAKFIVSIAAIACFVVFFATLVIGGITVVNKLETLSPAKMSYLPHVGAYFIFLFGVVGSVAALLDRKKA